MAAGGEALTIVSASVQSSGLSAYLAIRLVRNALDRSGSWRDQPGRGGAPPRGRGKPPKAPEPYRYTMADLERETGLTARTIRYYVSQGLLAPAHGRGPSATYDLGHLLRLRLIQQLKGLFLPLEDIKQRLGGLTDQEIAAMLDIQTRPPEDRWRRVQLHPDIELHVRDRAGKERDLALDKVVDDIIGLARPVIDDMNGGH